MGRVEVMSRFESTSESRDPLATQQVDRNRSSSEDWGSGGSSNNAHHVAQHANCLLRTTPTLMEEEAQNSNDLLEQSSIELLPIENEGILHELSSTALHEQRRLSSSLPASTSIVETLFGPGLGPCWGDFSCTYNRIRGRLYATSQAVLFYTNLLGFERRICLLLRDIARMELYRTTSIRFSTADDETYIFKSFNDREQVLHLLKGLKILANKQQRQQGTVQQTKATPRTRARSSETNDPFSPHNSSSNLVQNDHSPHINFQPIYSSRPSRQRAASDSILRLPRMESPVDSRNQDGSIGDNNSLLSDMRTSDEATLDEDERTPETPSLSSLWEQAKLPRAPPLQEVGIDGIVLPCDMDTFFQTFWADHAKHSLEYYQREYIKDQDVKLTGWDLGSDGYFRRTMQFRHPIQNSLGLGPSAADTTRQQKLRQYAGFGIVLENRTIVAGIPAADSFYVQDHWVLEAMGENQVKLTVHYDTRFTKRSMFKSIITKSIRKETKEWMVGYVDMVQSVLSEKVSNPAVNRAMAVVNPTPTSELQKLLRETIQSTFRLVVIISLAFLGLGVVACIHLFRLQQTVAMLHSALQQQQAQACQVPPLSTS